MRWRRWGFADARPRCLEPDALREPCPGLDLGLLLRELAPGVSECVRPEQHARRRCRRIGDREDGRSRLARVAVFAPGMSIEDAFARADGRVIVAQHALRAEPRAGRE